MKTKLVGATLGFAALSTLGVVAIPALAFGQTTGNTGTTCYPVCPSPTVTPSSSIPTPTVVPPLVTPAVSTPTTTPVTPVSAKTSAPTQAPTSGGLPFTGADIEGMAAIGGGAVVIGGVLVRRSRRLRRSTV
jgi:hypothetical protein